MESRETLCTRCKHRRVCKFVEDFLELEDTLENMSVKDPHSVKAECRYHEIDLGLGKREIPNREEG